jgi:hypothetical protein
VEEGQRKMRRFYKEFIKMIKEMNLNDELKKNKLIIF